MEGAPYRPPLVSVILPLYNGELYISKCIDSILSQTYSNFEIIIVDDASTDRSLEIALEYQLKHPDRIFVYNHPDFENHGISRTRNLCISNSNGEFLAFIDQDDFWLEGKLQVQINSLRSNPKAVLSYSKTLLIYSDDNVSSQNRQSIGGRFLSQRRLKVFLSLLRENRIYHCTCIVRRSAFYSIGLFPENQFFYEDWLCLLKLALIGDFLFIDQVLAGYRIHVASTSEMYKSSIRTLENEITLIINLYSFLTEQRLLNKLLHSTLIRLSVLRAFIRASSHRIDHSFIFSQSNRLRASVLPNSFFLPFMLFIVRCIPNFIFVGFRKVRRNIVGI